MDHRRHKRLLYIEHARKTTYGVSNDKKNVSCRTHPKTLTSKVLRQASIPSQDLLGRPMPALFMSTATCPTRSTRRVR